MTKAEQTEIRYLKELIQRIDERIGGFNKVVLEKKQEIDSMNTHMQEHKTDMDHLEKNALRETIYNYTLLGEHALEQMKRLFRLKDTAYFGRIDFKKTKTDTILPIYVGVHNFQDTKSKRNLVYDWRAPISALFYDFELGEAAYQTSSGSVKGSITLKRQFRIRKGLMEYMLDTDLTIHDEVLLKELNQASSEKMRNIVATIQKEQNAIIRNEDARHLIIQGVAGSGKTSVALHRIAFLLYRFKETISSKDILIISPNKVFAAYISNVLPELGEEKVAETAMEDIAEDIFEHQIKFQSFFDQVTELLEKNDQKLIERIRFKSSVNLLDHIDNFLLHLENEGFKPTDIFIGKKPVPAWFIEEAFQKYARLPILKRFNELVREIVENVYKYYQIEIQGKERTELHKTIRQMFPSTNLRNLYKAFYKWLDKEEFLRLKKDSIFEWSDIFPLIYLKMKLEGVSVKHEVKHLVIDEMQDYSTLQYKVLSMLFPCKKTIVGDINQTVNPYASSDEESIKSIFQDATSMNILKSYRSTYEIIQFTKRIIDQSEIEAVERHGDEPLLLKCKDQSEEVVQIKSLIKDFMQQDYNSLGIICKTQKQAEALFEHLDKDYKINLLNPISVAFGRGIVITTAHLAKGLEFDTVIVPFCTQKNYQSSPDRQMLYVACTRAMHRLFLTYSGKPTSFLTPKP